MNITIQRADLARTLAAVSKVVESRTTIPILANVLLSAMAGTLTVTGTDLDIQYSAMVPCEGEISTTVDARRLADIAKKVSGDTVSLTLDGDRLTVKSGRSRFVLPTLPVDDFPRLDAGEFDAEFKVDLAALVAPVRFAISTEETRYYLNGVYLHAVDGNLRAVATDGHRLAHNTVPHPEPHAPGVIIPRKTVGILPAGEVTVALSKAKIRITAGDTVLTSKLIDGTFPEYGRVIPAGNDKVLKVDRAELAKGIARVAAVAGDRGHAIKLAIAEGNIALSMRSDDGTANEDVPAEYDAEPIEIGFNSQYIGELLGVLSGDSVEVKLGDSGSPAIFTGEGPVLAVCMPMRVA